MTAEMKLLRDEAADLGVDLGDKMLDMFSRYATELAKWNSKINLTAITEGKDVIRKHFIDSLAVAAKVELSGKVLDIGSGAGFPGIPLKIARPDLEIVSVDAVEKKILFQKNVIRTLGLSNFSPLHARGESLQIKYGAYFDIIVSRAFADLYKFVKMTLPLLADDGLIIAMKGGDGRSEADRCKDRLAGDGAVVESIVEFALTGVGDRSLIIIRKYR